MNSKILKLERLKQYLSVILLLFAFSSSLFSQGGECAFPDPGSQSPLLANFDGLQFFDEDYECDALTLKCNFVIIRRDDGTGGLSPNSPFWASWVEMMNQSLGNITDDAMCSTGYPLDSKIRVEFEVDTINNTAAWDWYAEANADNFPSSSRPYAYICPRFVGDWDALEDAMAIYENNHFGEINFFFTDNGELVDFLEGHLEDGTEPNEPLIDRFEQFKINFEAANPGVDCSCGGQASGCSIYPKGYKSQASENSYVIANTYSDYLIRNNFHEIWWPQFANSTPETVWNWAFTGKPLLFLHEMGHNVLRTGHNTLCQQMMSDDFDTRTNHITKPQLEDLHRNLATTDLHNAVDCNNLSDVCPVQVVADEDIDEPMSVFGDLIVKDGVTLTVTSEIYFSEESRLIIEPNARLIVDGGLLTNGCGPTWKGIEVNAGFSGYAVEVINSSTIENTSKAAINMFAEGGWLLGTGNVDVKLENSTFNNCKRMLAMGAEFPSINESIIDKCTQNGGKYGITNWNCISVNVNNNTFNNITSSCIVSEKGQFFIDNNTFSSSQADILFANSNPGSGTSITNNVFNGQNTGIRSLGSSSDQHQIKNNQFFTGEFDIFMDGENNYRIEENDFTSDFAITSIDNGTNPNSVLENNISGNIIGLMPLGVNSSYVFYENCFNTSLADSWIEGEINIVQFNRETFGAANNCFTHKGNSIHPTFDIAGSPLAFTYVLPNDALIDCRDAVKAPQNINFDSAESNPSPCGIPGIGSGSGHIPPATQFNPCNPPKDQENLETAISWLEDKIEQIEENTSLTEEQKEQIINFYSRCLDRVKGIWIQLMMEEGHFEEVRTILATDGSNDAALTIYSTYVAQNELEDAHQYLLSINSPDDELSDFIAIQLINLRRLNAKRVYDATPSELQEVENIANKKHPYAGYAKALYYWLTGDILVSELPDFGNKNSGTRSSVDKTKDINTSVYPNPFSTILNIHVDSNEEVQIHVSDVLGKTWATQDATERLQISTENWPVGVYIVSVSSNGQIIDQKKVILLK